jgi:hypothetical protein
MSNVYSTRGYFNALLGRIASQLDGNEWNADTCANIADILREAGYRITEPETEDQGNEQE